ncbi:hypothetical protein [Vibrio sp. ER1A]|uniref:hypothetical protein n=1 Tax=Vibrio sp. ER1A TaxID=1517681 RepID=UPI0004DCEDF9|nr:hypothetical protein [Vibrio sp. ER1A]KFA99319.1 hypothetical protein HW45_04490 [Vibrio sp. ER1A]
MGLATVVPARLLRHGEAFDVMIAWKDLISTKEEQQTLFNILVDEVETSRGLKRYFTTTEAKSAKRIPRIIYR